MSYREDINSIACQNLVERKNWSFVVGKRKVHCNLHTSSMWSFESSVKARMSFLRIPSSKMNRRAPSLMVSVRSSFLLTGNSLDPCLHRRAQTLYIRVLPLPSRRINKIGHKKIQTFLSLAMQDCCSSLTHFLWQEQWDFLAASIGKHHP